MEESRVNWREQWRWRRDALCGAKALHVLEHLCHPLIAARQASRSASCSAIILASIS
jgi:hypothetical protein